jgi:microcystin-dependent protein
MSEPFLAEIKIVGFNFPPRNWAMCDGQLLPINQNQALFSLLGTTYGGDGRTNFALPDLRGRTPIHFGSGGATHTLGEKAGEENHTISDQEMPAHTHALNASADAADSNQPGNRVYSRTPQATYHTLTPNTPMNSQTIADAGGSQAHNNMQPHLVLNFVIALQGLFPSRD